MQPQREAKQVRKVHEFVQTVCGLYSRVARRLRVSPSFVSRVARGEPLDERDRASGPRAAIGDDGPSLHLGLRFDTEFFAGSPVAQGFSLPSVRVTAFGQALRHLDYRFSLGQTREFSSSLLPQMTPVEAFLHYDAGEPFVGQKIGFTFGMFTPTMNPWWTPDLTYLEIPDYNSVHRQLFLGRDLGAEMSWQMVPDRIEVVIGAFNGTGILGQNTNNGRAFNASIRAGVPVGPLRFILGTGAYDFQQGTRGGVNFRTNWVIDAFLSMRWDTRLSLNVDGYLGNFEDNLTETRPRGGSGWVTVGLVDWLKLFGRYEQLDQAPTNGSLREIEAGPVFELSRVLTVWVLYQNENVGGAGGQSEGFIRARLIL